jgi:light-regulated signal transduction histidine kinase (bacteriophytochrome)
LQNPIARIAGQSSIADIVQTAATEFQKITSYDRVMIYKFDPEWNGQVIAEAGTSEASLLWHQFPATDIPAQARRLFLINLMRSIVDIDAVPIQIIPEHDERNGAALDLSHSLLRSASPIHIQYLRNMGVQSSMTISLVVRGELWGMLTAHHAVAHRLDFLTRSVCELFGQTLSAHILARTDNWALEERIRSRARIESYMASVETSAPNSHLDQSTIFRS